MARKRYKPEEIVSLLRQAEVLHGQCMSMADALRQLGISEVTFYLWRKEYAGMSGDQLRRLKELEKEKPKPSTLPVVPRPLPPALPTSPPLLRADRPTGRALRNRRPRTPNRRPFLSPSAGQHSNQSGA